MVHGCRQNSNTPGFAFSTTWLNVCMPSKDSPCFSSNALEDQIQQGFAIEECDVVILLQIIGQVVHYHLGNPRTCPPLRQGLADNEF